MYMFYENNYIWDLQGGSGGLSPQKQKKFLKIKQNGGFSFIIFAFWQGSLDPQNYEPAPLK